MHTKNLIAWWTTFLIGGFTAAVPTARAAGVQCLGTVDQFSIQDSGVLEVDGSWNNSTSVMNLCYIDKSYLRQQDGTTISPSQCQEWAELLMAALIAQRTIKLTDAENGCLTGEWSSPSNVSIQ